MLHHFSTTRRYVFLAIGIWFFQISAYAAQPTFKALNDAGTSPFSLLGISDRGNVQEFFSSNKDNRLLIRVHLLGDTYSGVYYVPDNSTLLDVFGYAGGAKGIFSETTVLLYRPSPNKNNKGAETEIKIEGKDLLSHSALRHLGVQNGDIIFVDSPPKTDTFLRNLSIVSSILGIISASAAVYFIAAR